MELKFYFFERNAFIVLQILCENEHYTNLFQKYTEAISCNENSFI